MTGKITTWEGLGRTIDVLSRINVVKVGNVISMRMDILW
jgi:hypothetical protein